MDSVLSVLLSFHSFQSRHLTLDSLPPICVGCFGDRERGGQARSEEQRVRTCTLASE